MAVKIEKGIPVPDAAGRPSGPYKYPWLEMDIGDSLQGPAGISTRVTQLNKAYAPRKFTARKSEDGKTCRVWRIA